MSVWSLDVQSDPFDSLSKPRLTHHFLLLVRNPMDCRERGQSRSFPRHLESVRPVARSCATKVRFQRYREMYYLRRRERSSTFG